MTRKTAGALIGFAGAQVLTIVLFLLLAEPCECLVAGQCGDCLWGNTLGEYWAKYGLGGSTAAAVLGYLIADG